MSVTAVHHVAQLPCATAKEPRMAWLSANLRLHMQRGAADGLGHDSQWRWLGALRRSAFDVLFFQSNFRS